MEGCKKRKLSSSSSCQRCSRLRELFAMQTQPLIHREEIVALLDNCCCFQASQNQLPKPAAWTMPMLEKHSKRESDPAIWTSVFTEYRKASASLRPIDHSCSIPILCTIPISSISSISSYQILLQNDAKSYPLETSETPKPQIQASPAEEKNKLTLSIDLELLYKNPAFHRLFNLTKSRIRISKFSLMVKWFYDDRWCTSSSPEFQIIGRVRTQGKTTTLSPNPKPTKPKKQRRKCPPTPTPTTPTPRSLPFLSPSPPSPPSPSPSSSPSPSYSSSSYSSPSPSPSSSSPSLFQPSFLPSSLPVSKAYLPLEFPTLSSSQSSQPFPLSPSSLLFPSLPPLVSETRLPPLVSGTDHLSDHYSATAAAFPIFPSSKQSMPVVSSSTTFPGSSLGFFNDLQFDTDQFFQD